MNLMILISLILICFPGVVRSHARLMSPPSRSSMWRFGFPTPINFNDNQLYCGGLTIQWQKNGGKCGICGDPYNMPLPRPNEAGGKYGLGIISKRYVSGQVIDVTVDVTTNHRGYFEFKLCPNNNPKKEATQECLDKYILKEAHGSGTRYYIEDKRKGDITLQLQLPKGLICYQCVLQWTYVAGNNWGKCPGGNSGLGCGPQETFRGCADIAIHNEGDVFDVNPNVIDVESKQNEIPDHRNINEEHSKELTNAKFITYSYEVSKQTRHNSSETNFIGSHNHSHYDNHENTHPEKSNVSSRTQNLSNSVKKEQNSNEQISPASVNRRKYKYHNRNLYHFKNINPSTGRNPFDRNWDYLMNNNRFPLSFGQIKIKNQLRNKHETQNSRFSKPETRFKGMKLPLIIISDSGEDTSASEGFSLGGRRYKDFWLL